jgi:site-specific DNA-methyltransferase (adenine-specific)
VDAMTVTLYHGDCLDILPTLADKSVDAIITDVPYGTTACKWDVIIPLDKMWEQVRRLCKGAFVTTASQPFTSVLIVSNLDWFKYEWVWNKVKPSGFQIAKHKPMTQHENVLVFYKSAGMYNPQTIKRDKPIKYRQYSTGNSNPLKYSDFAERETDFFYPKSILDFSNAAQTGKEHPTQKPVALYEYLIKTYTNPGDTVLDFCAGSGTTGVAAIRTGRNAILIEREPEYFAVMERRIHEAQQMELV